ncbi:NUDIX hydrolase [Rhizobium mongolense]|uniref:NUDIX hydrolase n=1 Tax=Rhizobium mongolense TaxID=57676 RepID=UPI0034A10080
MLQEALMSEQKLPAGVGDIEQAGAICIRRMRTSRPEVLLVSSRRNGRWGLPKGHIEPNENSKTTAEREAFEEAGVLGSADAEPFGSFHYFKDRTEFVGTALNCKFVP